MRKRFLWTATALAASASTSFAGFTVTSTFGATVGGFDRWDIVAVNTGGDTGTQIKGLEYFYTGGPVSFQVDDTDEDGVQDTVNLLSSSRTRIRVNTTRANNVFVGVNPTNDAVQPNPYTAGASAFSGAIANTGTTNATGTGFQIARVFITPGTIGTFSGNLGGDIGSKVPFSVNVGGFIELEMQISISPEILEVDVGQFGNSTTGPALVTAQGNFDGPILSIVRSGELGVLADNIEEISFSPEFTIVRFSGLNLSDVGIHQLRYTATALSGNTASKTLTVRITPEPAILGVSICLGAISRRRRSRRG